MTRLGMSMFATKEDYLKARLEEAEKERDRYREELENIANAAWTKWESPMNTPAEFARWAQNRARHTLSA